ncbi:hypothetical protein [Vibrio phage S4-7]|nr:hypothetical protein [Vibrio phage S4-7]
MLKFKKNWLYRYNDWCDGNVWTLDNVTENKTLCGYFWGSFWNLVMANLLYVFISSGVGAIIGYSVLSEGIIPYDGLLGGVLHVLSGWGLFIGFLLIFTLFIYLWTVSWEFIKSKVNTSKEEDETKLSLVSEWVKAKKSKVCPLIKFED